MADESQQGARHRRGRERLCARRNPRRAERPRAGRAGRFVLPIARHAAETSTRGAFGRASPRCCIGRARSARRLPLTCRRRSREWRGWF